MKLKPEENSNAKTISTSTYIEIGPNLRGLVTVAIESRGYHDSVTDVVKSFGLNAAILSKVAVDVAVDEVGKSDKDNLLSSTEC